MAEVSVAKEAIEDEMKENVLCESLTDNLSIGSSSGSSSGTKDLPSLLTDAGMFSYASVIAFTLHELFNNEWDRKFNLQCISLIMKHLNLPQRVESVMIYFLDNEENHSLDTHINLLLTEPGLSGKPVLIIEDLVYLAVRNGNYDARMRVLIRHLSSILNIPIEIVDFYESSVVELLNKDTREMTEEEKNKNRKRQRNRKMKRYALIGLATLGGGAVLGLTGGLAAPLIGAGMGTILGAGSMTVLSSTAVISSLFGVAGAGLTGFKMKKRVGEVEEFAFGVLTKYPQIHQELHITIAISGWLPDEEPDNFTKPWRNLLNSREQYFLRYESQYLMELGRAMDYIVSFAVSMAAQEALKFTVLSGILTAISWPASLITLAGIIDNPWSVCCKRSAEVGKQLADVLLSREHGQRPVTLVGYSLGARVIYYCLREMSNRGECEGIVQDAVLLGAPVTGSSKDWKKLTRVVAGRLVNGYSKSDWLLKFLYRTFSLASGVAGLNAISCSDRKIINVDLTHIISGHKEYSEKIEAILKLVQIRTIGDAPTEIQSAMKKSFSDIPQGSKALKVSMSSLRKSKSVESLHLT